MSGLFHQWRHPRRCYVVCTIGRSGSNLLSDGLRITGRAGRPNQFFLPSFESYFRDRHGLKADICFADYVEAIIKGSSTSNEVFGFKVMAWYLDDFLTRLRQTGAFGRADISDLALLQNAFPRLRFIHIVRRHKLRQAISKARAVQTGLWKLQPGKSETAPVEFDRALINRCLKEAEEGERIWSAFFHRVAVEPFRVEYEELCQNYEGTIRGVFDFLQIAFPRRIKLDQPVTVRQSDDLSAEWEQRYLASDALQESGPD
jgi:LPS sulfotransferase NodH